MLETDFEGPDGAVRVIDFMPRRERAAPRVMRIVEGLRGRVPMRMELSVRPDYGSIVPWVEPTADGAAVISGPDSFRLTTPLPLEIADGSVTCAFDSVEGAHQRFTLDLEPLLRGVAAGRGRRLGAGAHRGVVARVERALALPRRL